MAHLLVTIFVSLAAVTSYPRAPVDLHAYVVDPGASEIYVYVHRAGLLSFFGHEHAVIPMEWSVDLCLAEDVPAGAHASLVVQTRSLVIDSDSARALAHMGGGPDEDTRREIRGTMLDAEHLAVEQYPQIRLDLSAAEPASDGRVDVTGEITLKGVTQAVALPVSVRSLDSGRIELSGALRIRQRDFGIEPESRAGLVKVSNDVDLHFKLTAAPTDRACALTAR